MDIVARVLRCITIEIRDWFFGVCGLVSAIMIPTVFSNWWLAIPVLIAFMVLYLVTLFYSSRLLKEK